MAGQIIFVIWRESIEALLVIGILSSWLSRNDPGGREGRQARAYLWGGVAAGFATAFLFALMVLGFADVLPAGARDDMMTAMIFIAAALIVQMVLWMRRNGRTLKRDLETGLSEAARTSRWWTVFLLAGIAVAREGSETVVFLYGMLAGASGTGTLAVAAAIVLGLIAALLTYAALQLGSRLLPWSRFFRLSEAMLLLLGCALFTTGIGNLIGAGVLPFAAPLWDTSGLLDDGGRIGGIIASLTGYRAQPDWVTLGGWIVYWALVLSALSLVTHRMRGAAQKAG
ncbi:MAG: FTR1 family protein [Rhodobacteraceae bacterium]|nr:FTR1 family protein [Paracoccaceae bacterium]